MTVPTATPTRPSDTYLFSPPAPPFKVAQQDEVVTMLPAAVIVEYWTEDDGSWAAHSDLLGVNAVADSEPELFAEMSEQIDEFWTILNERYATLSDDLKNKLQLRFLPLRFERTT